MNIIKGYNPPIEKSSHNTPICSPFTLLTCPHTIGSSFFNGDLEILSIIDSSLANSKSLRPKDS